MGKENEKQKAWENLSPGPPSIVCRKWTGTLLLNSSYTVIGRKKNRYSSTNQRQTEDSAIKRVGAFDFKVMFSFILPMKGLTISQNLKTRTCRSTYLTLATWPFLFLHKKGSSFERAADKFCNFHIFHKFLNRLRFCETCRLPIKNNEKLQVDAPQETYSNLHCPRLQFASWSWCSFHVGTYL